MVGDRPRGICDMNISQDAFFKFGAQILKKNKIA